jgi:hypothetical protein
MITIAPIAFVLVKFHASPAEPITKAYAEQRFTAAGRGTMNVLDCFDAGEYRQRAHGGTRPAPRPRSSSAA